MEDGLSKELQILISTHKHVDKPSSAILNLVQVGSQQAKERFEETLHDDSGDNISLKNAMYCELTTQYWAWKNVDAEYYGFCHYRRYFDFSETEHKENSFGEVMDDYIDAAAIREYGLDDKSMRSSIQDYDVITTKTQDLRKIIHGYGTPKAVWESAEYLQNKDLQKLYEILTSMHPDFKEDTDNFLNGHYSCFCNMFIMRKDIFFDYCAWLFPILFKFEEVTDFKDYSKEALRTPGHLSERLLNIYLMHHKRIGSPWKTKQLQCVHFTHPEIEQKQQPLLPSGEYQSIVPVVFAADNNYVPMVTTTIYSMMRNANSNRFFDVAILQQDISSSNRETMQEFFSNFHNMNLRFIDIQREISGFKLSTNNTHISNETYYRFLIQDILPFYDKVLYLDSDLIINSDVGTLFDTDIEDNLLAACHDIDYLGNLNIKHGNKRIAYTRNILKLQNAYGYFQAGVLVLNTRAMRAEHTTNEWLSYATNPQYIYNDQDVLNIYCEGKVEYLDWDWNVVHDCDGRVSKVFSFAPNNCFDSYQESRHHPRIIHYAGFEKPWKKVNCDFAEVYWRYARHTPFYEALLDNSSDSKKPQRVTRKQIHERALSETNEMRSWLDPILPVGSHRREWLKSLIRILRGRS